MAHNRELNLRVHYFVEELKNNPNIIVHKSSYEPAMRGEVTRGGKAFAKLGVDLHATYYSGIRYLKVRWEPKTPTPNGTFGVIDLPYATELPMIDKGFKLNAKSEETPLPSKFQVFAMAGAETAFGVTDYGIVVSHTIRSGYHLFPFDMNGFFELALAFKGYHRWMEAVRWAFIEGRPDREEVIEFQEEAAKLFDGVSLETVRAVFDRVKQG